MIKKKKYIFILMAILISATSTVSVNAATREYVDEQWWLVGFNDYGWVRFNCTGKDFETYSVSNNTIKRTGRSQFTKIEASRTDLPSFSPRMTDLAYYDANGKIKKKLNMKPQNYWSTPSWIYSNAKEDKSTVYKQGIYEELYSKFQVNVACPGSINAGAVFDFKFRLFK